MGITDKYTFELKKALPDQVIKKNSPVKIPENVLPLTLGYSNEIIGTGMVKGADIVIELSQQFLAKNINLGRMSVGVQGSFHDGTFYILGLAVMPGYVE